MFTELYIEALLADERLDGQVRELWNVRVVTDAEADWVWAWRGVL